MTHHDWLEISITKDQLSTQAAIDFVNDSTAGAISTFIGTTRDTFHSTLLNTISINLKSTALPEESCLFNTNRIHQCR